MKGSRKRKSSEDDREEKGRWRERERMEPNREMNSEEERELKMRKVDSEVYTVRRELINPLNPVQEDGPSPCKEGSTIYFETLYYRIA